ncbi:transporter substrate-binding domain-containing protein [Alteromonas sp. ASW11-36]|uniref:Transporter substrate-binding domain-containing protein n=1 Tax=Alteromonas arenosi TaxID=3055817 RepID=A0ABT7SZ77_9ALTE|nr:transporter substrate-binding domain-containing protein [Alteromonas sp. ASW11-36]MDM7861465.1 transporter substrate-binding domain-containing protein [Alteromonas sp. ASW11-36]
MGRVLGVLVTFSLFCLSPSYAQDDVDLNIYFEDNYRPYNFMNDGEIDGINGVAAKRACEMAELTCAFIPMPWTRAMSTVFKDPKGAVLSASRNNAREPFFNWIGPLVSSDTYYFKLSSRTDIVVESETDVLNYSIGVMRNDIYESVLVARGFVIGDNLLQTENKDDPTRLFLLGRLDLMIASGFTLSSSLAQFDATPDDVIAIAPLRTPELKGNYLATNVNVDDAIVTKLNTALAEFKRSKEFNDLVNLYRPQHLLLPDTDF